MFHLTTWQYCGKVGFSGAALPKPFRGTAKHQLEDPLLAFWQQGYLFFKITKACWNLLTIKMGPDNWSFFEIVRFALSIQMRQLLVGLVVLSAAEMFSSLNILLTDSSGTDRKSQIFHCPHYTSLHSLRQLFMGDTEADIDAWRKKRTLPWWNVMWCLPKQKMQNDMLWQMHKMLHDLPQRMSLCHWQQCCEDIHRSLRSPAESTRQRDFSNASKVIQVPECATWCHHDVTCTVILFLW